MAKQEHGLPHSVTRQAEESLRHATRPCRFNLLILLGVIFLVRLRSPGFWCRNNKKYPLPSARF